MAWLDLARRGTLLVALSPAILILWHLSRPSWWSVFMLVGVSRLVASSVPEGKCLTE